VALRRLRSAALCRSARRILQIAYRGSGYNAPAPLLFVEGRPKSATGKILKAGTAPVATLRSFRSEGTLNDHHGSLSDRVQPAPDRNRPMVRSTENLQPDFEAMTRGIVPGARARHCQSARYRRCELADMVRSTMEEEPCVHPLILRRSPVRLTQHRVRCRGGGRRPKSSRLWRAAARRSQRWCIRGCRRKGSATAS